MFLLFYKKIFKLRSKKIKKKLTSLLIIISMLFQSAFFIISADNPEINNDSSGFILFEDEYTPEDFVMDEYENNYVYEPNPSENLNFTEVREITNEIARSKNSNTNRFIVKYKNPERMDFNDAESVAVFIYEDVLSEKMQKEELLQRKIDLLPEKYKSEVNSRRDEFQQTEAALSERKFAYSAELANAGSKLKVDGVTELKSNVIKNKKLNTSALSFKDEGIQVYTFEQVIDSDAFVTRLEQELGREIEYVQPDYVLSLCLG